MTEIIRPLNQAPAFNRCSRDDPRNTHNTHKALVIAPSYPQLFGDVAPDVRQACSAIAAVGWQIELLTVSNARTCSSDDYRTSTFINIFRGWPVASKALVSPAFARSLRRAANEVDVIHAHGLWQFPSIYAARTAHRARKPYLISTHGTLSPEALRFSAIKKRLAWEVYQRRALNKAACLHATSEQEYRHIRALGLSPPVAIIPHGVQHAKSFRIRNAKAKDRVVLSLGRLHPIKGLDNLIAAWARIEKDNPNWCLQIVGPSEPAYEAILRQLAARLGASRVEFQGPRTGEAKAETFAGASLFVLPSRSENFALTVPEALSHGVPVIASKGSPWSALPEIGCGWWVDHGVDALTTTLSQAVRMSPRELRCMGQRGRDWVASEFTWESVAQRFDHLYRWLAKEEAPPPFVRFN